MGGGGPPSILMLGLDQDSTPPRLLSDCMLPLSTCIYAFLLRAPPPPSHLSPPCQILSTRKRKDVAVSDIDVQVWGGGGVGGCNPCTGVVEGGRCASVNLRVLTCCLLEMR